MIYLNLHIAILRIIDLVYFKHKRVWCYPCLLLRSLRKLANSEREIIDLEQGIKQANHSHKVS